MSPPKPLQRAAVLVRENGGYVLDIQEIAVPEPKPWEVLVSLSASGVCGTDVSLASGHLGPCRAILGHEGVGRIAAVGAGVDPSTAKIGDRVGVSWVRDVCGKCSFCRVPGGETRCVEQLNSGRRRDGTFAEYCCVPGRYLLVLPGSLDVADELVAPILCGGVTAYKALKSCDAVAGEWVAIFGAGGGVGGLGIQYARAMGFRVIAIDVGRDRKEECLAPAFDVVAPFGTVVCVGILPLHQTMSLYPLKFIDMGIKLIGSLVGTWTDTLEALGFVQRGVVKPAVWVIALDELPDAPVERVCLS
ncbi:GroES-like protein [Coniochaeta ligniaria NRRL 30616]|uniref:GroES-like protein n=1 Tax=Coniochaeta ligniaria NRRL 30616 TaxID=1408157 RepID=A0A1J7IQ72_9PEZI|nr:GroES-like protein [Coniochaeta ligniaria NRRL 30616]